MRIKRFLAAALFAAFTVVPVTAQAPQPPVVNGATNFCRLDANFASGGQTTPDALVTLKDQGFKSVVNLQTPAEPGVDIPAESAVASKAGMKYYSLPFSPSAPDSGAVDKFLEIVKDPSNQPVYIHCRSGMRANAFWMIKRVLVDGWTTEKAIAEADSLKMTNEQLRNFALDYVAKHKQE